MRKSYHRILSLSVMALLAGMVAVSTCFLRVPVFFANQAYIHLGDGVILLSAYMLSPKRAAAVSAIGSLLADILAAAFLYAVPTFFIKGIMGFVAGMIFKRQGYSPKLSKIIVPALLNGAIMLVGYFIYECFLMGIPAAALLALFQLIQAAGGIVVGIVLIPLCNKFWKRPA